MKQAFVKERGTNMQRFAWDTHEFKILFGDLNFRSLFPVD